ncbi:MAG TPA: hypothetical protein VLL51_03275 [Gemmatimonadales bacterium]|nr:hypothetical protein [Gemmatimonadales bacterium]
MTEQQRVRIGIAGIGAGLALLTLGILIAHFTGLAETDAVGREIYPHIPRCMPWENEAATCWMLPTAGQAIGLVGSQLLLGGIVVGWILGRPLTWVRAAVGAFLFTVEAIILFGVVPNQWLTLAQGTFEWTQQKIAFTLPTWLTLNNEVSISYGTIKDIVSGGYSATMLGLIAVAAYQLQERAKRKDQPPPLRVSAYGRPMVKGGR